MWRCGAVLTLHQGSVMEALVSFHVRSSHLLNLRYFEHIYEGDSFLI
jgi:hypothetical protein